MGDNVSDYVRDPLVTYHAGKAIPALNFDSHQYQQLTEAWQAACCGDVYKMDVVTQTGEDITERDQHGATCMRAAVRIHRLIMLGI